MAVAALEAEIDRVAAEVAEIHADPSRPHCPPSKGMSGDVGYVTGLEIREQVLRQALALVESDNSEESYPDLSYRERVICTERDRGVSRGKLAERFSVTPDRIGQYESQARLKLAALPLEGERLESLVDRIIGLARRSDAPDLSIRAEALAPFRSTQPVTKGR